MTVIGLQENQSIGTFMMDEWEVPDDITKQNKRRKSQEIETLKTPKLLSKAQRSIDQFENSDIVLKLMYREKTHRGTLPKKQNGLKLRLLGKYSPTQALRSLYRSSYFTETTGVTWILSCCAVGCFLASAV